MNPETGSGENFPFSPSPLAGRTYFVNSIRESPLEDKIAISVELPVPGYYGGIGPWEIWIIDLEKRATVLYVRGGTDSSPWIEIDGWKDDTTPEWNNL